MRESNVIVHFYIKGLDYSNCAIWLWKKGGEIEGGAMGTIVKSEGSYSRQGLDGMAGMPRAMLDEKGTPRPG